MFTQKKNDLFLNKLEHTEYGRIKIQMPDGKTYEFKGKKPGPNASVIIKDSKVISNLALKGDIGLLEDYTNEKWDTNDLQQLIAFGLYNKNQLNGYFFAQKYIRTLQRIMYYFRKNSVRTSKKNIHAHYDLGNDFYQLWLDRSMTYSSALYEDSSIDLYLAQKTKYNRILERTEINSGEILEIGCGWGGFIDFATQSGDYKIKGITLSEEQHNYANKKLSGRADIILEDYRIQNKKYDSIVSIEMFEAVGMEYWEEYFNKIYACLKQNGRAVIQTITMNEENFKTYVNETDFIRSYIFPGGMLPSANTFKALAEKSGLKIGDAFSFGQDYSKTLAEWLKAFDNIPANRLYAMGFDDRFIRLWRFYLAGCAAGFQAGHTNVYQFQLVKQ